MAMCAMTKENMLIVTGLCTEVITSVLRAFPRGLGSLRRGMRFSVWGNAFSDFEDGNGNGNGFSRREDEDVCYLVA